MRMTASILSSTQVAIQLRHIIKKQAADYLQLHGRVPGLAVILLGEDPASHIYVNHKYKACQEMGFYSLRYALPAHTSEIELLQLIDKLNHTAFIDGILVQLPLPLHINTQKIIANIHPLKDVDGFHPYNLGCLAQGHPKLRPCTPWGIIKLLEYYDIQLSGKHAVIIGASNIVGKPMAFECLLAQATVTICHSETRDLQPLVRSADIIIVATGHQDVVNVEWLNKKQIIVDVGMHRLPNNRLRGDIDFHQAKDIVRAITPVPGGVGPMTICMLLENTLLAAKEHLLP
jgi:methylenetetrahydrofolate dehydrogenase (NADP+)/methenyltetrahydrofolate cyclohydrolase